MELGLYQALSTHESKVIYRAVLHTCSNDVWDEELLKTPGRPTIQYIQDDLIWDSCSSFLF